MVKKEKSNATIPILLIIAGTILVTPIIFVFMLVGLFSGTDVPTSGNVAHIPIYGVILTSGDPWDSSVTSSAQLVQTINSINEDDSIKGVIFEINSPGGSGVASDEIATAIKALDKPSVSYIREVGASGSYWIASATDKIYANKFSTVGSIGVIASYLEFSGLLEEYNVSYQRFVAGENKDFGSPFREPSTEEVEKYQELLDSLHTIFIAEVAANRELSVEYVKELADGSIYSGMQSVENQLVDEIGGRAQAIAYIEKQIGKEATLIDYYREPSFLSLLSGLQAESFFQIGRGIGSSLQDEEKHVGFRT